MFLTQLETWQVQCIVLISSFAGKWRRALDDRAEYICSKPGTQVAAHCQLPLLPMCCGAFITNDKYHRQACVMLHFKNSEKILLFWAWLLGIVSVHRKIDSFRKFVCAVLIWSPVFRRLKEIHKPSCLFSLPNPCFACFKSWSSAGSHKNL